jgi:hypothetical protein
MKTLIWALVHQNFKKHKKDYDNVFLIVWGPWQ